MRRSPTAHASKVIIWALYPRTALDGPSFPGGSSSVTTDAAGRLGTWIQNVPMPSEPGSGLGEYFAAVQARTLRRAFKAVMPNVGEMFARAHDEMWRDAAAKVRAQEWLVPARQRLHLSCPTKGAPGKNGVKGGRPRQWFYGPSGPQKQLKAEEFIRRGFANGKSDREISDALADVCPEWGHERFYRQRVKRFR